MKNLQEKLILIVNILDSSRNSS